MTQQRAPKKQDPKTGNNKRKRNEPNKGKKGQQAPAEAVDVEISDFDLLEEIFRIEESPVAKKTSKGQKQPGQDIDPTMAISVHHITIIEAQPTDFVRTYNMKQRLEESGDFGDDFGANEKQFNLSFPILAAQQTHQSENIESLLPMELDDVPDELRGANASNREFPLTLPCTNPREDSPVGQEKKLLRRKASVKRPTAHDGEAANISQHGNYQELPLTLPEESLCGDIMNIVGNQMKSRKRRASVDLSTRVEASKGMRLDAAEVSEVEPSNNLADPVEVGHVGEPLVPMASSTPNKDFAKKGVQTENDEENIVQISPISPIARVPKKRVQKRKLCVDKVIKLPADSLTQRTCYYQEHSMVDAPLESFTATFFRYKVSNEPYFTSPSSRLKKGAEALLAVFKRNLKRVSNASKRKRPDDDQPEQVATPVKKSRPSRNAAVKDVTDPISFEEEPGATPVKKSRLSRNAAVKEVSDPISIELPVSLDPLEVPSFDELAPMIPMQDLPPEIEEFAQAPAVAVAKPAKKAPESSFKER